MKAAANVSNQESKASETPDDAASFNRTVARAFDCAVQLHSVGQIAEATQLYEAILEKCPAHPAVNHNLGVIRARSQQCADALPFLLIALEAEPTNAQYWLSYIEALALAGRRDEALNALALGREHGLDGDPVAALERRITQDSAASAGPGNGASTVQPRDVEALVDLLARGRGEEAEDRARELTERHPDDADAWNVRGAVSVAIRRWQEAESCYTKALTLAPNSADAHFNLAQLLHSQDRVAEARQSFRRAVDCCPTHAEAHNGLGNIAHAERDLPTAEFSYRRAAELKPDWALAYFNLGTVLLEQGKYSEARSNLVRALELNPQLAEAHNNLGVALARLGRAGEAEASYRRALELSPQFVDAMANLGSALADQCRMAEAATTFFRAAELAPIGWQHAINARLLLPAIAASRSAIEVSRDAFERALTELETVPGVLSEPAEQLTAMARALVYHDHDNRRLLTALHSLFRARVPALTVTAAHVRERATGSNDRRIRIGIVSEFLCAHSVGMLYRGLIRHLDRSGFEVTVVHAPNAKRDAVREHIDATADSVLELPTGLAAQQAALAAQQFDVLFYPDLGSSITAYFLAYARLAPVQVTGIAHPDTSAIDAVDYFVSARYIEPDAERAHQRYSERLVMLDRLPCFYVAEATPVEPVEMGREQFGLPAGTLYGCPESLSKFHPDFDAVLAGIAERDSNAVIVAIEPEIAEWATRLRERWANSAPILLDRVVFIPRVPVEKFAALLAQFDVLLDPLYVGFGHTLYEATLHGTPVVTLPGRFMRGRLVAGAYEQMKVVDAPVAKSIDDYIDKAVKLGCDVERRNALRKTLAASAKQALFEDRVALGEFEVFLRAAVSAAVRGERLPNNWSPTAPVSTSGSKQAPSANKNRAGRADRRRHGRSAEPTAAEVESLVAHFDAGRFVEAEAQSRELLRRYPKSSVAWKALGTMLSSQSKPQEALEPLQMAARLAPGDAQTLSNLGAVLADLGRWTEAEEWQRKALALQPDFAEAHCNLGVAEMQRRDWLAAQHSLERATQLKPNFFQAHFKLGLALKGAGRLHHAAEVLRRAVSLKPDSAEAYNNLGVVLSDLQEWTEAERCLRRALELDDECADAHYNLGTILAERRQFDAAEASYRAAIRADDRHAEAYNNLGGLLRHAGRHREAEEAYRAVLAIDPDRADALNNLGIVLKAQERFDAADDCFRRALTLQPDMVEAHYNYGILLQEKRYYEAADSHYERALALKPEYVEAHNNYANSLSMQHRYIEAEAHLRQVLHLRPEFADAYNNLGVVLRGQGRLADAEAACRRALQINPDFAEAQYNLGNVLVEWSRFEEGEASYRRALQINPEGADAQVKLGNVLREQGNIAAAIVEYRGALQKRPDHFDTRSNLLFDLNYTESLSQQESLAEAREYGRRVAAAATARHSSWVCDRTPQRLRVGLVSGDLRNHPVGFFLEAVLAHLDRERIEVIAYASDVDEDELSTRLKAHLLDWKPLRNISDQGAAQLIHDDGVHVLLDLSGHTAKNRLPMFALRPAPVQATWLGYFATTGVDAMDYVIADRFVAPESEQADFTESIWRLPESYLCFTAPDLPLPVGPLPALENDFITFGSFNNLNKMNEAVVALWAKVLHAVPNSRLLLKTKQLNDKSRCDTTRANFARHGIDANRLLLERSALRGELMQAYQRMDIALDPFPYPGGTTSVEALWMGVPVITRRGDRFLSRMGESIAHNAGMSEWIARDDNDYVAIATAMSADRARLATIRGALRNQVLASPLFDAPRFARHFEAALWGMWNERGLKP